MAGNANSGGRNAKPRATHILHGTFRKDRHGDSDSVEPPQGVPTPPKKLSREARGEWDRMIVRLEKSGALSLVDDAALYQYVQLFAETEEIKGDHLRTRQLSDLLKRKTTRLNGRDLVEAVGKIVQLQQLLAKQKVQLRQGHMALRQYLVEFGLTPSARTRVKLKLAETPVRDARKERFFGRGGA